MDSKLLSASLVAAVCWGSGCAPESDPGVQEGHATAGAAEGPVLTDRSLLANPPQHPVGVYGFSRYFYSEVDGEIVPQLIEGPAGRQVRCQDEELPCSYLELKALLDSGAEIPKELEISREELTTLVSQLDALSGTLARYKSIHDACAAGYRANTGQANNMGIHMGFTGHHAGGSSGEFDPANPDTLLFAMEGGELLTRDARGQCEGDRWVGPEGYRIVGAVFKLPPTPEHPGGFAGPFDNWHAHFNACGDPQHQNDGSLQGSKTRCLADGGTFVDEAPNWMIHAYAVPEFDNQAGVFAMFNPRIWPLAPEIDDPLGLEDGDAEAILAPILDFSFGSVKARVGQTIRFQNQDPFPHTVTAGVPGAESGAFDSGPLGQKDSVAISFDAEGEYKVFCKIHPEMRATITVK